MVRLVFRPYTQIRRSICTSEPLRASTRVSSGFTLLRHSSPSFGSRHMCSYSNLSQKIRVGRWCKASHLSLSLRTRAYHPNTRTHVRLLGPCFKTGRWTPFRQPAPPPRQRRAPPEGATPGHLPPQPRAMTRPRTSAPLKAECAQATLAPNGSLPTISSTL